MLRLFVLLAAPLFAGDLIDGEMETKLVPGPLKYSVLVPDGYASGPSPYPLMLNLHGGGGTRDSLGRMRKSFEELWANGTLPKMVIVTPSAERSFYMDYKDGSQKWETLLVGPFLDHLRAKFKVRKDAKGTLLLGVSMGGMGVLRFGLKYPQTFGALAALEPGIEPALQWKDVLPRHRFWRSDALLATVYGKPFDSAYWEANNPPSLAIHNRQKIVSAGLAIYLECGDEDAFGLDEATEFMHQTLRNARIPHEYHLVRGADHVGRSIAPTPQPPDVEAERLRRALAPMRKDYFPK
jgi:S-formylglutathione hydrolase